MHACLQQSRRACVTACLTRTMAPRAAKATRGHWTRGNSAPREAMPPCGSISCEPRGAASSAVVMIDCDRSRQATMCADGRRNQRSLPREGVPVGLSTLARRGNPLCQSYRREERAAGCPQLQDVRYAPLTFGQQSLETLMMRGGCGCGTGQRPAHRPAGHDTRLVTRRWHPDRRLA